MHAPRHYAILGFLRLTTLPAAAALLLALVVIHESRFQGRLAMPPGYDDVAYMRDGVGRLITLYEKGVTGLLSDLWLRPPHSPLESALAATGFAIFGMVDWAPYAMNSLVALLLLGLPVYVFRRSPWLHRALVMAAMVSMPVTVHSIREFRPDIMAAAFIAWGLAVALDPPESLGRPGRPLLIGAVFGLSLLAKSSTSPVTVVIFGMATFCAGLMHNRRSYRDFTATAADVLGELSLAGLALLVVAGPYYATAYPAVYHYIHTNVFEDRAELWKVKGGWLFHLRFYVDGEGGWFMLGKAAYPLLAICALGGVLRGVLGAGQADARARIGTACLLMCMLLAYGVCTWNPMKQGFLGLPFQLLLLLGGLQTLRLLLSIIPEGRAILHTALLACLAAAAIGGFRFINIYAMDNTHYLASRELYDEAYQAIRAELGRRPALVLVTFTGAVNETNLEYRSHVDGAPFTGQSREEAATVEDYEPFILRAELVLAAQSGTGMTNDEFPSGKIHDPVIDRLERDPKFKRVWTWESATPGREFRLYHRISAKPAVPAKNAGQARPAAPRSP